MAQTAKLFRNGRSQAVRLPAAFRFNATEVFIRKDPATGDVILSRKPDGWAGFIKAAESAGVPAYFLSIADRQDKGSARDPFLGWRE